MTSSNVQNILEKLSVLHPRIIDLSLDRILHLLEKLGHPHRNIKAIHVAGTNGKGSTLAFLKSFFEEEGYCVNAYISPHLLAFNERIILDGKPVDDAVLADALDECEKANEGRPITFFEITTAAAFLLFSRSKADITLCETGLGGRFDATNVLESTVASILTPIDIDHTQYLGNDLALIAKEKAGIIKKNGTVISSRQASTVDAEILRAASDAGAKLYRYGRDWRQERTPKGFIFHSSHFKGLEIRHPALLGRHQNVNAATALACVERLDDFSFTPKKLQKAAANVHWPGRMQSLDRGSLRSMIPKNWELWLDGAHNPAAARALGEILFGWVHQPLYLLFGMMKGKNPYQFLRNFSPFVRKAYVMAIPGVPSSLPVEDLLEAAGRAGIAAQACSGLEDGMHQAAQEGNSDEHTRVLICGSLYLASAVLGKTGANKGK